MIGGGNLPARLKEQVMTRQANAAEDGPGAAPVACTLSPADLAAQAARWQRLASQAMTGRRDTADGVRLSFRPGPGVEDELRALVALEARCCAWATWTVQKPPGELVLAVASVGQGIAALHGMFTGLPGSPAALGR
jgi:hypothetical protein